MAEELDLDLDNEEQERVNKVEKRIKDLSEKVRLTSEERDEFKKANEKVEAEKVAALKDADFFKNFNPLTSKYQAAAEYQDKIREKVMAGYEIEDATISILAKEGKLTTSTPSAPKENPAGGSATTNLKNENKALKDMSRDEKLSALKEAEAKGDISLT